MGKEGREGERKQGRRREEGDGETDGWEGGGGKRGQRDRQAGRQTIYLVNCFPRKPW